MGISPEFSLKAGYTPGLIGRISELHGIYYHHHWKFGIYFEAKVATELSEFLTRFDKQRDGIWFAAVKDRVEGSISIDGIHASDKGAHLRWFIVSDELRGKGAGRQLLDKAIHFCRTKGYKKIYLWTFEGLHAARRLYEDVGFKLMMQQTGVQWGTEVNQQYFEFDMQT